MNWLINTGETITTVDGKIAEVWELNHQLDENILSEWAKHFREQYCLDSLIDRLRRGTGLTREQYLVNIKFPDRSASPGPSIRAGDFAEILVADFLEYLQGYWVPRTRYNDKTVRNESTKGVDTIGFLFSSPDGYSPADKLAIYESKAKYTGIDTESRLQVAVKDSGKDSLRKAESLNAIKQRFIDKESFESADKIERFQDEADRPYIQEFGAVAHLDNTNFDLNMLCTTDTSIHPHSDNLKLFVIKGLNMMSLVHHLYERAANEA